MALEPKNFLKAATLAARQFLTLGRKVSHTQIFGAQPNEQSYMVKDAIYRIIGASGNTIGYSFYCKCGTETQCLELFSQEISHNCGTCGTAFNIKERALADLRAAKLQEVDAALANGTITTEKGLALKNTIMGAKVSPADALESLRMTRVRYIQPPRKRMPFVEVSGNGDGEFQYERSGSSGGNEPDPFAGPGFADPFAQSKY